MSDKLNRSPIESLSLKAPWQEGAKVSLERNNYGTVGQISTLISHALLDYIELVYQSIGIKCVHGPIGVAPFKGAHGIHLTSAIGTLNPIMATNLELFLDMIAEDGEAQARDIHIFRDHSTDIDRRVIIYNDAREMMEYTHLLYKDKGIRCDFTRQYDQTVAALKPRNNANGFYLN